MRYAFIAAHTIEFSMALMCRALRVSRSGYYAWRVRPESKRDIENQGLLESIKSVFKKSRKTYGSPRVHHQLVLDGETCSRGRVERLGRRRPDSGAKYDT